MSEEQRINNMMAARRCRERKASEMNNLEKQLKKAQIENNYYRQYYERLQITAADAAIELNILKIKTRLSQGRIRHRNCRRSGLRCQKGQNLGQLETE